MVVGWHFTSIRALAQRPDDQIISRCCQAHCCGRLTERQKETTSYTENPARKSRSIWILATVLFTKEEPSAETVLPPCRLPSAPNLRGSRPSSSESPAATILLPWSIPIVTGATYCGFPMVLRLHLLPAASSVGQLISISISMLHLWYFGFIPRSRILILATLSRDAAGPAVQVRMVLSSPRMGGWTRSRGQLQLGMPASLPQCNTLQKSQGKANMNLWKIIVLPIWMVQIFLYSEYSWPIRRD